MTNGTQKSNNNRHIYTAIIVILLCTAFYSFVRSCGNGANIEHIHKSTDTTVDTVEAEHANAGRELDTVGAELISAGTAVDRADQLITASQERVNQNAASLADCQRLVSDCRKIVADCNRIYAEAEKANRSGTESGG